MTIEEANRQLISQMSAIYDEREAAAITAMVMENLTGMTRSRRLLYKSDPLSEDNLNLFHLYLRELTDHRPVQYVLGEAWFAGLRFQVDERVLIPRPETAELLDWIAGDLSSATAGLRAIDLGTGSGCLAVGLAKKRPDLQILACDISAGALELASRNAVANEVKVDFFSGDILDENSWENRPLFDCIVSNPPYIPEKQKASLENHVKNFEPELALFVPDANPLIHYEAIARLAKKKLAPEGKVFLEVHHDFAKAIVIAYREKGFSVDLRKDLSGKNRMIRAQFC